MREFFQQHSRDWYPLCLIGGLVVACILESFQPHLNQRPTRQALGRWINNLLLAGITQTLLLALEPLMYFGVAQPLGWVQPGWLQRYDIHPLTGVVFLLLVLECVTYWLHRACHSIPLLWRLHAVHHADTEVDFSTAHRHHPGEALVSTLVTFPILLALGPTLEMAVIYHAAYGLVSALSHANLRLGTNVDVLLRRVVVTPAFHRVHHSANRTLTDSNFGTLTPWFDHLFGTACIQDPPADVGLTYARDDRNRRIDRLLMLPFKKDFYKTK